MFIVGDKVRIKSWEQMEDEFSLDVVGDINCDCGFIRDMKDLCGMEVTIEKIDGNRIQDIDGWAISFDMIEKI